jgi:NADH dehydrogenase
MLLGREDKIIMHIPVTICRIIAVIMRKVMKRPLLRWNMIAGVIQDADLNPSEATADLGYRPHPVEIKLKECFPRKN